MFISVCLALHNGEKYLKEQVISILESLYFSEIEDFEVIISDDGSCDKSLNIIKLISDPRIKLIEGPRKGLIRNFERLLYEASGDLIFLSDQDDIWMPEKVKICIDRLKYVDLIISNSTIIDASTKISHKSFFRLRNSGPGFLKNLYKNTYLGCCMCFRKEKLYEFKCLPFPDDIPMHDWWLGLKFDKHGKVDFVEDCLVMYRRHGNNNSSSTEKSNNSFMQQFIWRWILVKNLFRQI